MPTFRFARTERRRRSSAATRRSSLWRVPSSGRDDESFAPCGQSQSTVQGVHGSPLWMPLGPAERGAELESVGRAERMKSQQPRRPRLDRLHIGDHVTDPDELVHPGLGHARDLFIEDSVADQPAKRGNDFHRSQGPHHHRAVRADPGSDTRRKLLLHQKGHHRRAVPESHRPSSRSRRRAATTSAPASGLRPSQRRGNFPVPRRITPRRSSRSNHSASASGTREWASTRSIRAMTRSRSQTRID